MDQSDNTVDRVTIKPLVIAEIVWMTSPNFEIKETDKMWPKLRMGPSVRAAMALPYSRIAARFAGLAISQSEAKKLKTVKASIDLVHKRANGEK